MLGALVYDRRLLLCDIGGGSTREVVRVGAAVLRVAIGLDRSHRRAIVGVRVAEDDGAEDDSGATVLVAPVRPDADLSLELYAATERSGLLADVFGIAVTVAPELG